VLYDVFDEIADKVNESVAEGVEDVSKQVSSFG